MTTLVDQWAEEDLAALEARSQRRALEALESPQGPRVRLGGRAYLNFSSNDYLSLAAHPAVLAAGRQALERWGAGAGASRLVVGDLEVHGELERALAGLCGDAAAVVFSSGAAANMGALVALVGEGDVVFSDALNHASIIDGCRLSRARVVVYRHGDVAHLEQLVRATPGRRRLVVTDTVFSMDGDRAPLADLAALCRLHGLALMVDEAHATGVLGPTGGGLTELAQVRPDVHVGTLSKALGGGGGWVSGSRALVDLVVNRARTFVFSTGLPPVVAAMGVAAVGVLRTDGPRRAQLARNIERLAARLRELGVTTARPDSAVFSVVVGSEDAALRASASLRAAGLLVKAIRPPTVPVGTSRLRVSVCAGHQDADLATLEAALAPLLRSAP